jgi:hypothetical protein
MNEMLEYLIKKLDEEQKHLAEALAMGKAKDFAEYKELCGVIRGVLIARILVANTAERLESSDE